MHLTPPPFHPQWGHTMLMFDASKPGPIFQNCFGGGKRGWGGGGEGGRGVFWKLNNDLTAQKNLLVVGILSSAPRTFGQDCRSIVFFVIDLLVRDIICSFKPGEIIKYKFTPLHIFCMNPNSYRPGVFCYAIHTVIPSWFDLTTKLWPPAVSHA